MAFSNYKEIASEYGTGGSDWMKLEQGDNKVRFVSEFIPYGNHFDSATKKSLICIGKETCEVCKSGDRPRVQFLGWVIDRNDAELKLLRIGYKIYEAMGKLAESEEYAFDGFPPYDITINKTGEMLETEYSVIPARENTELTNDEKLMIDEKAKDPQEIVDSMKAKVSPDVSELEQEGSGGDDKIWGDIPVAEDDKPDDEIDVDKLGLESDK